jgi:O-antigen ligase
MLLLIAGVFSLFIAMRGHRFHFTRIAQYGASSLVVVLAISLLFSGNLVGAMYGETGRFVGFASACALLVVAIFHSQFNPHAFLTLLKYYIVAVELVVLVGFAQHFNLIELPGDQGIASTLGNVDFFAAFVGTSLPLFLLLAVKGSMRLRVAVIALMGLNVFALRLAGPLQGFVDLAILTLGLILILIRKFIPRFTWTLNARTYIGIFSVVIWAEVIFLVPFLGKFIPVLGNDVQVKIRSNFWLAGMRQFFSHPYFGVGPDQYGNYYEQYRTLDDVKHYTNILSNDAHAASVQTLATTGLFGTLAFLFLLALVIRSLLILWDTKKIDRVYTFLLGLYIFTYLTNSFVSPITLTNKYLFWSICGFIVGQTYRLPSRIQLGSKKRSFCAITASLVLSLITFVFIQGQLNYLINIEKYAENKSIALGYKSSPVIPCMMYFNSEIAMASNDGSEYALKFAQDKLRNNPRCVNAQVVLTQAVVNSGNLNGLKELVYHLYEIAPARGDTISFGMYYANRAGDQLLASALQREMRALGLTYVPGKLG